MQQHQRLRDRVEGAEHQDAIAGPCGGAGGAQRIGHRGVMRAMRRRRLAALSVPVLLVAYLAYVFVGDVMARQAPGAAGAQRAPGFAQAS